LVVEDTILLFGLPSGKYADRQISVDPARLVA
jgi:hypothetical protein